VKSCEEIMEILEAFDLTGSLRGAAALAGCDHKTVAHDVALRDGGQAPGEKTQRAMVIDEFASKIEEWVDRSRGRVRADVVHEKLIAMGFTGSERTTRRAVAAARKAWWSGHRRVFRPWVPEPGLWLQFDWGTGPRIAGRSTLLFCAWLAWSRFRVVIATWDRTLPTLLSCLDSTLRAIGGAPTYALTDNEKSVTVEHIARVPIRHPDVVSAGRYYGMTIRTCMPADPQSKGGDVSPAWRSTCCGSPKAQHAGRGGRSAMKRHRHTPEQVVRKLREGERLLNEGKGLVEVLRHLEISEPTWNRWRNQYGGMKADGAKRLRELEVENGRLKRLLAEAELDKAMLKELAEGNF
jgi:transposase/transposase-like protein